jgi:hypothetical protein
MLKSKSLCLSGWIVHDLLQHLVECRQKRVQEITLSRSNAPSHTIETEETPGS